MEIVVADPGVDHRAFRHRRLERGVRVDLAHQRGEAEVGRADRPDLAVAFGHVLHQPVDRVVGVGALVDPALVERPGDGPGHDERALGAMQPPDVLDGDDVPVLGELLVHRRQDVLDPLAGVAERVRVRVVGRARQQHRRVGRALLHHDDRVELGAVAHRDHDLAPDEVRPRHHGIIVRDDVRRHRRDRGLRCGSDGEQREKRCGEAERELGHRIFVGAARERCKRAPRHTAKRLYGHR